MRSVIVSLFVSLDGVAQAPGAPDEDTSGGFALGGWTVPFWDDAIEAHMGEVMAPTYDLLLGRHTYEIFAAHWPHADDDFGRKLTAATKYVASTTLTDPTWANTEVLTGDVAEAVAALKDTDGPDLSVSGSPTLVQTLLAHDLVDRFDLLIYPVVLGTGKRLFGEGCPPRSLRRTAVSTSPSGVIMASYERAGAVETGTFGAE